MSAASLVPDLMLSITESFWNNFDMRDASVLCDHRQNKFYRAIKVVDDSNGIATSTFDDRFILWVLRESGRDVKRQS